MSGTSSKAPKGRKKVAQGKEQSDAALGSLFQQQPSPEGATETPEDWTWTTLGEIADVKGGITLNKSRKIEDPIEVPYLPSPNNTKSSRKSKPAPPPSTTSKPNSTAKSPAPTASANRHSANRHLHPPSRETCFRMNTPDPLHQWFTERPTWLQEAARRILTNGEFTDTDLSDCLNLCKNDAGIDLSPVQIQPTQKLSGSALAPAVTSSQTLHIERIKDVAGVNAISLEAALEEFRGVEGALNQPAPRNE